MGGEKRLVVSWVWLLKGFEYQTKLSLYSVEEGELCRVLSVDSRHGLGHGAHKRQGKTHLLTSGRPRGCPGRGRPGRGLDWPSRSSLGHSLPCRL